MIIKEGSRHVGVKDCGIFAIATATLLANGDSPSTFTFDQHSMTGHLLKCLKTLSSVHPSELDHMSVHLSVIC